MFSRSEGKNWKATVNKRRVVEITRFISTMLSVILYYSGALLLIFYSIKEEQQMWNIILTD